MVVFNTVYGAVATAVQELLCAPTGASLKVLELPDKLTAPHQVVQLLDNHLQGSTAAKVAVFSHVTSPTAIVLPVLELIRVCRAHGVLVVVDGAHSLGQLPLRLDSLQPDFYVTNGHKWLCNVRGAGLLYALPPYHALLAAHPPCHTWGRRSSKDVANSLQAAYVWQGTADYSAMFGMRLAVRVLKALDGAPHESVLYGRGAKGRVLSRQHELVHLAAQTLTARWGTHTLVPADGVLTAFMLVVALPPPFAEPSPLAASVHDLLLTVYGLEVPVFTYRGRRYVRVSLHVYNELAEVEILADAVQQLADEERAAAANACKNTHLPSRL